MSVAAVERGVAGLGTLAEVPARVKGAAAVVAKFDQCLLVGFGRLGAEHWAGLEGLGRVVAGTPIEGVVSKAIAAVRGNEFSPGHFAALAAARAAVLGAAYDELRGQVGEALGRGTGDGEGGALSRAPQAERLKGAKVLCDSARHWLMEVAITGFKQLDAATLAPFAATLENLQAEPAMGRLAALLSGYRDEMLAALPIGHASPIPVYRWADLWTRGMVTSLMLERGGVDDGARKVSGTLSVLGVDLRQHGCFVSAVVYGVLEETGGAARIVRVTVSSYKVDALAGREVWRCFADPGTLPLLKAVSQRVPLKVKDATLTTTGDLIWDGEAADAGKAGDAFATAAKWLAPGANVAWPTVVPADRHPVQLGELVLLDDVTVDGKAGVMAVSAGGATLPVTEHRLGEELTADDLKAATSVIGLLRFDGGAWRVQPLAVRPGATKDKKATGEAFVGSAAFEVATRKPKKGEPNTLAVLKERAGRLLRKKA